MQYWQYSTSTSRQALSTHLSHVYACTAAASSGGSPELNRASHPKSFLPLKYLKSPNRFAHFRVISPPGSAGIPLSGEKKPIRPRQDFRTRLPASSNRIAYRIRNHEPPRKSAGDAIAAVSPRFFRKLAARCRRGCLFCDAMPDASGGPVVATASIGNGAG